MNANSAQKLETGIRMARQSDVPAIVRLGIDALKSLPAPNQRISTEKLQELARDCVFMPQNFAWVAVKDSEVVGAVCALVQDQAVYERKAAVVVQFWCPEHGEGIKLIREFLAWARPQRRIKAIIFTLEAGADPRIGSLLERVGLAKQEIPVYVEWR